MLMTERQISRRRNLVFPQPERTRKVKKSMGAIKHVLGERKRAHLARVRHRSAEEAEKQQQQEEEEEAADLMTAENTSAAGTDADDRTVAPPPPSSSESTEERPKPPS